jgi:hypothetical protein
MTEQAGKERHALGLLSIGYHPETVGRMVGLDTKAVEALTKDHGPKPDVPADAAADALAETAVTQEKWDVVDVDGVQQEEEGGQAPPERSLSPERTAILELLERSEEPMKPAAVAETLGMKPGNVRYLLAEMRKDGQVQRSVYGKYSVRQINNTDESTDAGEPNGEGGVNMESISVGDGSTNEAHTLTTEGATSTRLTAEERIAKRKERLGKAGITFMDAASGGSISWEEKRRRKGYRN